MDMKKMIQRMTDLENAGKTQLNESETLSECPPMEAPMAAPANPGNPVTMSITLNASGNDHVADLINLMKNAGLQDAKPAADAIMPMRQDMDRLRAIVGEPEMEADAAYSNAIEEGAMSDLHAEISSADDPAEMVMDIIKQGGPKGDYLSDELEKAAEALGLTLTNGDDVAQAVDALLQDMGIEEAYDNEPDPEYQDHHYMTKDLSSGLNREKKAYAAAQPGDNAMAVEADDDDRDELSKKLFRKQSPDEMKKRDQEKNRKMNQKRFMKPDKTRSGEWGAYESDMVENIAKTLYAKLAEKKAKPDFLDMDKDGDKKEPMKKAIADKKKK